jgi:hypothetical protein
MNIDLPKNHLLQITKVVSISQGIVEFDGIPSGIEVLYWFVVHWKFAMFPDSP